MKYLLTLLLAIVAGLALADPSNPCNVSTTTTTIPYADFAAGSGFACAPAPAGVGTMPTLRANAAGVLAYWYCPSPSGVWSANWTVGTVAFMGSGALAANLYSALASPNPVQALNALAAKNVSLPLNDPSLTPIWCPFAQEMVAGIPAAVAQPSVAAIWRTPASGTQTLYQGAGGRLTAIISGRKATPGALCDCASKAASGGSTYCSISGGAAYELTLCQPAPK